MILSQIVIPTRANIIITGHCKYNSYHIVHKSAIYFDNKLTYTYCILTKLAHINNVMKQTYKNRVIIRLAKPKHLTFWAAVWTSTRIFKM